MCEEWDSDVLLESQIIELSSPDLKGIHYSIDVSHFLEPIIIIFANALSLPFSLHSFPNSGCLELFIACHVHGQVPLRVLKDDESLPHQILITLAHIEVKVSNYLLSIDYSFLELNEAISHDLLINNISLFFHECSFKSHLFKSLKNLADYFLLELFWHTFLDL